MKLTTENKTGSPKTTTSWYQVKTLTAIAALATMTLLSACGSSGGSNNTVATVPGVYGTNGFFGTTGFNTGAYSTFAGGGQMLAYGVGDMTSGGNPSVEMGLVFGMIGGGVAAQGQMIVAYPYQACGIPVGTYQLQTIMPGQFTDQSGTNYAGIQMMATGTGGSFTFTLIQAGIAPANPQLYNGSTYPRLQGSFQFGSNICGPSIAY